MRERLIQDKIRIRGQSMQNLRNRCKDEFWVSSAVQKGALSR